MVFLPEDTEKKNKQKTKLKQKQKQNKNNNNKTFKISSNPDKVIFSINCSVLNWSGSWYCAIWQTTHTDKTLKE